MHPGFVRLKEEKRKRIINAAMKEFTQRGYDHASTDRIVETAGISKGLLFHYFGTKRDLFLFLFDHALNVCESDYLSLIDLKEKDIFNRIRQNALLKLKLIPENPDLFGFIMTAASKCPSDIKSEIISRQDAFMKKAKQSFFSGLDFSKFRENVDPQKAMNVILWTVEGFSNKVIANQEDPKRLIDDFDYHVRELDHYMHMLKLALYKNVE